MPYEHIADICKKSNNEKRGESPNSVQNMCSGVSYCGGEIRETIKKTKDSQFPQG